MREIKFRAWDKKEKKMLSPEVMSDENHNEYSPLEIHANNTFLILQYDWEGKERYTLMQYTGLKDKNGVEIYEGDIGEHTDNKFEDRKHLYNKIVCEFKDGAFIFKGENVSWYKPPQNFEVIGNIYEKEVK